VTALEWHAAGTRLYETGIDRGVLYPSYNSGVVWNGLISVNEEVAGGDVESYYFDGVKYRDTVLSEDFKATIEAFSAPAEFSVCEGKRSLTPGLSVVHQNRPAFNLSYRTLIGNEVDGTDHGYLLHLVYNAKVSPQSRNNTTIGETIEPGVSQWSIVAAPPHAQISGVTYRPSPHLILDSRLIEESKLALIEALLYGTSEDDPLFPPQNLVYTLLA
jgi:hypothetical protein